MLYFSLNEYLPVYTIFILVLIVSAKYIPDIIPCKIQRFMEKDLYFRHLLTFFTMIIFVVFTTPLKDQKVIQILIKSVFLYIIFLLYVKSNYKFFAAITILSCVLYISMLRKYEIEREFNETKNEETKKNIEKELNLLIIINNILLVIIIFVIIIGFLLYLGEKKIEYKKDFNYVTFFLGKIECGNKDFKKISMKESLKGAFTLKSLL
jgi:hypothetical protein